MYEKCIYLLKTGESTRAISTPGIVELVFSDSKLTELIGIYHLKVLSNFNYGTLNLHLTSHGACLLSVTRAAWSNQPSPNRGGLGPATGIFLVDIMFVWWLNSSEI